MDILALKLFIVWVIMWVALIVSQNRTVECRFPTSSIVVLLPAQRLVYKGFSSSIKSLNQVVKLSTFLRHDSLCVAHNQASSSAVNCTSNLNLHSSQQVAYWTGIQTHDYSSLASLECSQSLLSSLVSLICTYQLQPIRAKLGPIRAHYADSPLMSRVWVVANKISSILIIVTKSL